MKDAAFETKQLPVKYDDLAPDGSEIRLLLKLKGGSAVHCTLPPGKVSLAHVHRTIEEIWYFISGHGQVWRKQDGKDMEVDVKAGSCLTIPLGAHFQFRNTGQEPLCFVITTMPPWPGAQEAMRVPDHWQVA
jgi:mannose-6-phosphate isomerase-like protein (cupin superfamily)